MKRRFCAGSMRLFEPPETRGMQENQTTNQLPTVNF